MQHILVIRFWNDTIQPFHPSGKVLNWTQRNRFNKFEWYVTERYMYIFLLLIVPCGIPYFKLLCTHFYGQHRRKSSVFIGIIKFVHLFSNISKTKHTTNFNLNTRSKCFFLIFLFWMTDHFLLASLVFAFKFHWNH